MCPLRVSVDVPSTPRAPVFARRLLRDVLKLWALHDPKAYQDIELLATEVVTKPSSTPARSRPWFSSWCCRMTGCGCC